MTETPEVSEETAERDAPEQAGREVPEQDLPPAGPRGIDGESRVVAERSGADTTFPERPLLADPDDARRTPEEETPEGASHARAEAEAEADAGDDGPGDAEGSADEEGGTSGNGTPEPEVGPAS
ncbi:hypothetical protein [Streptosporangium sp. NPDC048865]|uniref:hypothetical protein n=1 Tax=Streptosporangium sp. NPDC048865 TaxID=3155766 RepID=UPI00343A8FCF